MADFIDFFNKGLEAADKARENKEEIDTVIQQLSDQLNSAASGKLKIEIIQKNEPVTSFAMVAQDIFNMKTYLAIAASNPLAASYQPLELARWKISESGYPCNIVLPDYEIYCEDKKALENALGRLIALPTSGKVFQQVMNQKSLTDADD